ncbi:MAG: SpaA isopeptide-forming pilin-related protein [Acutalibacteraceae bacterium]|nr:SpaA isopeptide-forming pilin-related protein [Acutalibacteraceae bacterium]
MNKRNIPIIKEYTKKHKKRSTRQRVLMVVAVLVVFCTTYAMILPAITMENKNKCTIEEHIHKSDCYGTQKVMTCQQEVGKIHAHNENCYTATGELTCKIDTTVEHAHTETCYTSKMTMVCDKPMHQHNEECTATAPSEAVTVVPTEKVTQTSTESTSDIAISEISKDSNTAGVNSADSNSDAPTSEEGPRDLKNYLLGLGPGHSVTHKVYHGDQLIENLDFASGDDYTFVLEIEAKDGILPDTYQYVLPAEIQLNDPVVDGWVERADSVNVGTYEAKQGDQVVITMIFNEFANNVDHFYGTLSFRIKIDNGAEIPEEPAIKKTGLFNESTGMFEFDITATIPAYSGSGYFEQWFIHDSSKLSFLHKWIQSLENAEISIVTDELDENGENIRIPVPNIANAGENDKIAYVCSSKPFGENCLFLVNRCKCSSTTLCNSQVSGKCMSIKDEFAYDNDTNFPDYPGWCACWNSVKNTTLSIKYENNKSMKDSSDLINEHGGGNYQNTVTLSNADQTDITESTADVTIPKIVNKFKPSFSLENGYVGSYTIAVNENRIDLSKVVFQKIDPTKFDLTDLDFSKIDPNGDQIPDGLFLQDKMTNAAYIPGSMNITAISADESAEPVKLKYGTDYEVQYIPNIPDNGNSSVIYEGTLNIIILNTSEYFGAYKYNVDYRAQAVHPDMLAVELIETLSDDGSAGTQVNSRKLSDILLSISNNVTASIYLGPSSFVNTSANFAENWRFRRLALTVEKVDFENHDILLPKAKYGLYTQDGYEISTAITNENGLLEFSTNVRKGIHFDVNQPYYVKELEAPTGYSIDTLPHWFYFADNPTNSFVTIDANIMFCDVDETGSSENNVMTRTNEKGVTLPETGGCGTVIYSIAGSVLMLGSAYALYKKSLRWRGVRR